MKKMLPSFRYIINNYFIVLLLYFSFYLASGGMENNIPFLFEERGMVGVSQRLCKPPN